MSLGARLRARLFLTSAAALFAEVALIRWVPANIWYVNFFANFVLIASFLGIGLGILIGTRVRSAGSPFAVALFATTTLVFASKLDVRFGADGRLAIEPSAGPTNTLVALLVFVLVAATLAAVSVPLARLFRDLPPLQAYAIDIAGAIAGVLAFAACSALGTDPLLWFGIVLGLVAACAALDGAVRPSRLAVASGASALVLLAGAAALSGDLWSPYYRISPYREASGARVIAVNGIPHQTFHAVGSPDRSPFYEQVYRWLPGRRFERVLVIGAGNGTDVAGALAHGASLVDAVEIDPLILELGVREHPDRPYDDPRVRRTVDDGRAFLRRTTERYDLIVFALTDSLTLVPASANLRLESFLYTREALTEAAARLAPDGVMTIYNFYSDPWLVDRLAATLREATGEPPLLRTYGGLSAAHAAGPGVVRARSLDLVADATSEAPSAAPEPTTDDWPFLYLLERGIPTLYSVPLALIVLIAIAAVLGVGRAAGASLTGLSPHFFALGAAFLLLETKSLASFALLFGTTWVVNVLAIVGVLLSVLAAIAVNARRPVPRALLYPLLFASLLVAYALPPDRLLLEPPPLRYLVAVLVAFAPIFLANLVFTRSFAGAARPEAAFASNLLGAVVGGVLEYAALVGGYRQLLLIVAALYAIAWLAARARLLGDGVAGRATA